MSANVALSFVHSPDVAAGPKKVCYKNDELSDSQYLSSILIESYFLSGTYFDLTNAGLITAASAIESSEYRLIGELNCFETICLDEPPMFTVLVVRPP